MRDVEIPLSPITRWSYAKSLRSLQPAVLRPKQNTIAVSECLRFLLKLLVELQAILKSTLFCPRNDRRSSGALAVSNGGVLNDWPSEWCEASEGEGMYCSEFLELDGFADQLTGYDASLLLCRRKFEGNE